ncbi:MAG: DUF1800 domain-containing protein [Pseudomonadota bacterium]
MFAPQTIAAIRYGYGFAPGEVPPRDAAGLISALSNQTPAPRVPMRERIALNQAYRDAGRENDETARQKIRRRIGDMMSDDFRQMIADAVTGPGFAERLVWFWADHFTVAVNSPVMRLAVGDYIASAIRPHIGGRFQDMLQAVVTHPAMLVYLDQISSVGPNSVAGQRRDRGLNENLAREILELHTLGVGAPYNQTDVRELANLLTGLSVGREGFTYRHRMSEPGERKILGKTYGRRTPGLDQIKEALGDIAMHPATARHLAEKLVVHFVGGPPDPDWTRTIAMAYLDTGGDLRATYAAMLADARAWTGAFAKAKTPFDFIVSALRASGATAKDIADMPRRDLRQGIVGALGLMGQPPFQPQGPDGWPENPEAWITPPGLAGRIRWAAAYSEKVLKDRDPRSFLETALGDVAPPTLRFAVAGAESRIEGCALTLASPEFNRR